MVGSPQVVTQSMTLHLSPKSKYARASLQDPLRASSGCKTRRLYAPHRRVSRRCASPGPPLWEVIRGRRGPWHDRCLLLRKSTLQPRTRSGRARCMDGFVHKYGPAQHTRGPTVGPSPQPRCTQIRTQRQGRNDIQLADNSPARDPRGLNIQPRRRPISTSPSKPFAGSSPATRPRCASARRSAHRAASRLRHAAGCGVITTSRA